MKGFEQHKKFNFCQTDMKPIVTYLRNTGWGNAIKHRHDTLFSSTLKKLVEERFLYLQLSMLHFSASVGEET